MRFLRRSWPWLLVILFPLLPLWRAAFRVLDDPIAAEDAVQDGFLNAWRALDRFDEKAELSTWLYRIVINAAIDHRRERRRRESSEGMVVRAQRSRLLPRCNRRCIHPRRLGILKDLLFTRSGSRHRNRGPGCRSAACGRR